MSCVAAVILKKPNKWGLVDVTVYTGDALGQFQRLCKRYNMLFCIWIKQKILNF